MSAVITDCCLRGLGFRWPGNLTALPKNHIQSKTWTLTPVNPDGPETSLPIDLGSGAGVRALGARDPWTGLYLQQSLLE